MSFPSSLDSFTTPTATQPTNNPSHSSIHSAANSALSALETKLGIDSSAATSSIDYLLKNTASVDPGHKHTLSVSVTGTLAVAHGGTGVTSSTGTVAVVLSTSPTLVTPVLGVASATSINKVAITAPATSATLTIANSKTLTVNNTLTLAGTDSTTMTFPGASDTLAGLGTIQTFTALNTFKQINFTNNAITAVSNAATVPITNRLNTVTNNSAATLTITMTTTSAVDGQLCIVRVLDSSAAAQTITWVNTENSTASVPTTSNGSTTLFKSVGFMFNGGTSLWRCLASS